MRIKEDVEPYRILLGPWGSVKGFSCGMFIIPFQSSSLRVLVSDGSFDGWEHVSVSMPNRCANWKEMCYIKDLFWDEEDTVLQFHPPKSQYINNHPYCLHLWRQINKPVDLPPWWTVGIKDSDTQINTSKE